MTKLELRYFEGCPNWKIADERLRQAIRAEDVDCAITYTKVETLEDAQRLRFIGSPSILINGTDPFRTENAQPGLACRIFNTENGPDGAPSITQLRALLS